MLSPGAHTLHPTEDYKKEKPPVPLPPQKTSTRKACFIEQMPTRLWRMSACFPATQLPVATSILTTPPNTHTYTHTYTLIPGSAHCFPHGGPGPTAEREQTHPNAELWPRPATHTKQSIGK